ncbi:MAG: hypothetical protein U9Q62_07900 [Campylobacterota bacterium]|nr:hypothetical protein [Campylobacterota bacterium]
MIDTQLVEQTLKKLEELVPIDMYALDFTTDHYKALMEMLVDEYSAEYLDDNRGAIKEAIVRIFSDSLQTITIALLESGIQIEKAFVYPKKDEHFDRMLHKVTMRLLTVEDNPTVFKPVDYLWILPADVRSDLFGSFRKVKLDVAQEREYIRERIVEVFELESQDIVLFLRSSIYILYYVPPTIVREGEDKRYAGQDPEEMEMLFNQLFPDGAWELIESYMDGIFADKLDFTRIDNETFIETFIPVFRSMIEILLVEYASQIESEKVEGLVGYVLRQYFDDILIATAWEVLALFQERDRNAEAFIRYFKDEIIINEKGKKIQKHAIIDEKGQKWNHNSILSTFMQYEQAEKRMVKQKEKIATIVNRLDEAKNVFSSEKNGRFKVSAEVKEAQMLVIQNQNLIDQFEHKIEELKEKSEENIMRLTRLKKERETVLERSRLASNNADYANRRYKNKQIDMQNWEKQYQANQTLLQEIEEQNEELMHKVELIVKALATVMTKR